MNEDIKKMIEVINNFKQLVNENNDLSEKEVDRVFNNAKNYLSKNNKVKNHYHNNTHMLDVFKNAMMLFNEYKKEHKLNTNDKLCLGLAAIFHDFNHSGGKLSDSENIKLALNELKTYLKTIDKTYLYEEIEKIINATEFPHKDIDLNIIQKIIRDADTMGGIKEGWVEVVKSLAKESNKTFNEFIPLQIKFLNNTKFNTDYCNDLLKNNKEEIIEKLNKMK